MARLDRYRIGIPRELSEIRTQPWLSEGSLTCDPANHINHIKIISQMPLALYTRLKNTLALNR